MREIVTLSSVMFAVACSQPPGSGGAGINAKASANLSISSLYSAVQTANQSSVKANVDAYIAGVRSQAIGNVVDKYAATVTDDPVAVGQTTFTNIRTNLLAAEATFRTLELSGCG